MHFPVGGVVGFRILYTYIYNYGVTPAGTTKRYYIAGGLVEEGRQENTEEKVVG